MAVLRTRIYNTMRGCAQSLVCLVLSLYPVASYTQADEVEVKLAYIFQLLGYTEWPGSYAIDANPNIDICYAGKDAVTKQIHVLEQASTAKHAIRTRKVSGVDATGCHILYFGYSSVNSFQPLLEKSAHLPILTFSGAEMFLEKGGMVEFHDMTKRLGTFEEKRVVFLVNRANVKQTGLRIDPSALAFAEEVIE